jgi:hypothetical protein
MNSFLIFKFQDHFNGQNKVQFEQGLLFALLFQQLKMFVELHSHNGNPFWNVKTKLQRYTFCDIDQIRISSQNYLSKLNIFKNIFFQFKYLGKILFYFIMISICQIYVIIYQSNLDFGYQQLGFHIFHKKNAIKTEKNKSKYQSEKKYKCTIKYLIIIYMSTIDYENQKWKIWTIFCNVKGEKLRNFSLTICKNN